VYCPNDTLGIIVWRFKELLWRLRTPSENISLLLHRGRLHQTPAGAKVARVGAGLLQTYCPAGENITWVCNARQPYWSSVPISLLCLAVCLLIQTTLAPEGQYVCSNSTPPTILAPAGQHVRKGMFRENHRIVIRHGIDDHKKYIFMNWPILTCCPSGANIMWVCNVRQPYWSSVPISLFAWQSGAYLKIVQRTPLGNIVYLNISLLLHRGRLRQTPPRQHSSISLRA